jgi:AcrR family transcriptional regulator
MPAPEPAAKPRLQKGALTRELIVAESLAILDRDGTAKFTLPRLGRALGADQTAVYRHFGSKDDLVVAIAERLFEEAFAGFDVSDDWIVTLRQVALRVRATFLRHPSAAALTSARVTNQPAEMAAADAVIGAFLVAGFTQAEAALYYRVVVDFAMLWNGGEADFMNLPPETREAEQRNWVTSYRGASSASYPHIEAVKGVLFEISNDDVFDAALELLLESLRARADRTAG